MENKQVLNEQFHSERQQIIQLFAVTEMIDGEFKLDSDKFVALDIKHAIEHLLANYQKLMHKHTEF